jgi:hypothetical protein
MATRGRAQHQASCWADTPISGRAPSLPAAPPPPPAVCASPASPSRQLSLAAGAVRRAASGLYSARPAAPSPSSACSTPLRCPCGLRGQCAGLMCGQRADLGRHARLCSSGVRRWGAAAAFARATGTRGGQRPPCAPQTGDGPRRLRPALPERHARAGAARPRRRACGGPLLVLRLAPQLPEQGVALQRSLPHRVGRAALAGARRDP